MREPQAIKRDWLDKRCIVIATGPSLTNEMATACRMARWLDSWKVIAINDAYRLAPWADILYGADFHWWKSHKGAPEFRGERCTSHSQSLSYCDDKSAVADQYALTLIAARDGDDFSRDPAYLSYGEPAHSGFQAVNLALLKGASPVLLVGFDYGCTTNGHFFGNHPAGLRQASDAEYKCMARAFDSVTTDAEIINVTPGSALARFKRSELSAELHRYSGLRWYGAKSVAGSS